VAGESQAPERIWREAGLKVSKKQIEWRRLWPGDGSCLRLRPQHKDPLLSCDFIEDATHDGRKLRILVVIDEFSRKCLAIANSSMRCWRHRAR
jgi:hypothetical protein